MFNQLAQYYRGDVMFDRHTNGDDQWITLLGFIVFIAVVSAVLFVVYKIATKPSAASQGSDPINIANERYAKGEITKDELAEIKATLSQK